VHYEPYAGAVPGLAQLPWIAASPSSAGIVGHLFYYDRRNVWERERVLGLHMYSGGQSPDGRISMKILWALRRGNAAVLRVQGRRLDGGRRFSEVWGAIAGNEQFPSIIDVPTSGCWRLTVRAGQATAQVTVLVV